MFSPDFRIDDIMTRFISMLNLKYITLVHVFCYACNEEHFTFNSVCSADRSVQFLTYANYLADSISDHQYFSWPSCHFVIAET